MKELILSFFLLSLCLFAKADNFVILAAGSYYFWNYRHQADIFHAYQIFRDYGIPADNIITFAYDDIAYDEMNPYPGQVFNRPSTGPGKDVYSGVRIDYSGEDVTPENFLNVLKGNSAATGGKKVLTSTEEDNVFIYFADHGSYGLLCFPEDDLFADDFIDTLHSMHANKMYKKMVIYIEACESGSMFEGLLPNDMNIYVTTAAEPEESSWATYCNPNNTINGVTLRVCLGDLYSINFLENLETIDPFEQTLETQFNVIKSKTTKSHPQQYGQLDFLDDVVGSFEAYKFDRNSLTNSSNFSDLAHEEHVDSRLIKLAYLLNKHNHLQNDDSQAELKSEIESIHRHDRIFKALKEELNLNTEIEAKSEKIDFKCLKERMNIYKKTCGRLSDYGLKYGKYIHYSCAQNTDLNVFKTVLVNQCQRIEI